MKTDNVDSTHGCSLSNFFYSCMESWQLHNKRTINCKYHNRNSLKTAQSPEVRLLSFRETTPNLILVTTIIIIIHGATVVLLSWRGVILEDINPLTSKSDQYLISPYNITPESHIEVTRIEEMINKLLTWLASGADVGSTILFCTAPILTIRGLRICSSWTSNLYPASSKFPCAAIFRAPSGSSNLLFKKN